MTIPAATPEELDEYRDLEAQYAWASQEFEIGVDPDTIKEALRVLSHYQRENERLARELKSALADTERIDWLEGVADYVDMIVDGDHASLYQYYNSEKTLREAIDERRQA